MDSDSSQRQNSVYTQPLFDGRAVARTARGSSGESGLGSQLGKQTEQAAQGAGTAPRSERFADAVNEAFSAASRTVLTEQWRYRADNSESAYSCHLYGDWSRLSRRTVAGGHLSECAHKD